ncbi:hypothetical protein H0H93_005253 [Arthromyces matolae]|nr:hypothetical protein H0H93_005253 [Arthromyces matolae]
MKAREYCCCAIPIVNAGIYSTLIAQFVTALVIAILSVATPSIVGAATPSFAPLLLAIVCFVAAIIQVFGFIGVAREKPILFRRYTTLHGLISLIAFAVAAAWVIISATRHSTSKSNCLKNFFSDDTTETLADRLCDIFPWVDVGIMAALRDHEKYDALKNDSFPMNSPNDPWDSRPSTETPRSPQGYTHVRNESTVSTAEVLSQPQLQPKDSLSHDYYNYQLGRKATGSNRLQKPHSEANY